MKKKVLFMAMAATLLMAGCSQEEITPNGGENNGSGETTTSYLAVNLVSSDNSTRAADGYEDGTSEENKVNSVRFYFFNGSGSAVPVKLNGTQRVNYYDWTPETDDQKDDKDGDYIESIVNATIVINTADGDRIPQRIAAILNPSTSTLGSGSQDLDDLKKIYRDYATTDLTKSGGFVMFNAVYAKDNTAYSTALIESKNLCKDKDDALKNPVVIKVERNVAKVKVTLDSQIGFDANDRLLLKDSKGNNIIVKDKQVYLKLNGWDLTAEAKKTRLVKKINPSAGGGDWWNGVDRSFWAINAPEAGNSYHDYDAINNPFLIEVDGKKVANALYSNENAEDNSTTDAINRTKVIISGTLCDADGNPFTIARHMGAYYADSYNEDETQNLTVLKTSILNMLATNGRHYFYAAGNGRDPIGVSDLKIVIAKQEEVEGSKNNCYVYAQLTDDAAKKEWYDTEAQNATSISSETINTALKNKDVVDWALVWNGGKTYYYYEIKHTLGGPTLNGVVRNHIYDTKVTKIAGLGTPVYDPDQVIYPEKPDPNDHYIAAEINILSWRIVSDEYELEW